MQITLATLADWAATTDKGKLVIGGVFDTIHVRELPARHPMMALALRILAHPGEEPEHTVSVRLVDPDGEALIPELTGKVRLPGEEHTEGGTMQFVLHLPGVGFRRFGPHAVDILIDGEPQQSIPLWIREAVHPQASPVEDPTAEGPLEDHGDAPEGEGPQ